MLEKTYFRAELVQLIVSRSDSELEVQRYSMKKNTLTVDVDPIMLEDELWMRQREKLSPNCQSRFFENQTAETEFLFFLILISVQFGSVFRKPMSDIFIGFCTTLVPRWDCYCVWLRDHLNWSEVHFLRSMCSLFICASSVGIETCIYSWCLLVYSFVLCLCRLSMQMCRQRTCSLSVWPMLNPRLKFCLLTVFIGIEQGLLRISLICSWLGKFCLITDNMTIAMVSLSNTCPETLYIVCSNTYTSRKWPQILLPLTLLY